MSVMPYELTRVSRRIEWSIVSKAAERSRSVRTVMSPVSRAVCMSLVTFRRAVSVLWADLYADWLGEINWLMFKY